MRKPEQLESSWNETFTFFLNQLESVLNTFIKVNCYALVLQAILLLALQGCVMYQPPFTEEEGFRESPTEVLEQLIEERREHIMDLLSDPEKEEKTAVLQGGLEEFQRERIMDHLEDLFEEVHSEDFEAYRTLCIRARNIGILNFDRYSPTLLAEIVENYENPEKDPHKPIIFVPMQRTDEERIFGIHPLNVEVDRLSDFTQAYKLLVVETEEMSELMAHIDSLERRSILKENSMAGVIVAAHGQRTKAGNGITLKNMDQLSRLNRFLRNGSHFVWACCNGALQEDERSQEASYNLSAMSTLLFPKSQTIACNRVLEDVEFDVDEYGYVIPNTIQLLNLNDHFFFSDSTERPNRSQVVKAISERVWDLMTHKAPKPFVKEAVEHGITSAPLICRLNRDHIRPSVYASYRNSTTSREEIFALISKGITSTQAEEYYALGMRTASQMIDFYEKGIHPEKIVALQEVVNRHGFNDLAGNIHHLWNCFVLHKLPYDFVKEFYDGGVVDFISILSSHNRGENISAFYARRARIASLPRSR